MLGLSYNLCGSKYSVYKIYEDNVLENLLLVYKNIYGVVFVE